MREYVRALTERKKWQQHRRNLQLNYVVLVIEPNTSRGVWPVGLVIETYPGHDGVIKTARVRTKTGEYTRPVLKLCVLETRESSSDKTGSKTTEIPIIESQHPNADD